VRTLSRKPQTIGAANMLTKVLILASFHRFVFVAEGKPEAKEIFPAGRTVEVSDEDADAWIAAGLAKAV